MLSEQTTNNYEKWCEEWGRRFLTLDQEALLKRVPGLTEEGDCRALVYFQQRYRFHKRTGQIEGPEGFEAPSAFTKLNLYTLLWYCQEQAAFLGEWLPFYNLKDASPFGPAFRKNVIDVYAATFSGHLNELHAACQSLGGLKLPHSDAGYEIRSFDCIPLRFLFWDMDEEFPAQANILFDKGSVNFIHVESLVTIASEGLALLAKAAGLPLMGNTFS